MLQTSTWNYKKKKKKKGRSVMGRHIVVLCWLHMTLFSSNDACAPFLL
jgi:hypothetical protein